MRGRHETAQSFKGKTLGSSYILQNVSLNLTDLIFLLSQRRQIEKQIALEVQDSDTPSISLKRSKNYIDESEESMTFLNAELLDSDSVDDKKILKNFFDFWNRNVDEIEVSVQNLYRNIKIPCYQSEIYAVADNKRLIDDLKSSFKSVLGIFEDQVKTVDAEKARELKLSIESIRGKIREGESKKFFSHLEELSNNMGVAGALNLKNFLTYAKEFSLYLAQIALDSLKKDEEESESHLQRLEKSAESLKQFITSQNYACFGGDFTVLESAITSYNSKITDSFYLNACEQVISEFLPHIESANRIHLRSLVDHLYLISNEPLDNYFTLPQTEIPLNAVLKSIFTFSKKIEIELNRTSRDKATEIADLIHGMHQKKIENKGLSEDLSFSFLDQQQTDHFNQIQKILESYKIEGAGTATNFILATQLNEEEGQEIDFDKPQKFKSKEDLISALEAKFSQNLFEDFKKFGLLPENARMGQYTRNSDSIYFEIDNPFLRLLGDSLKKKSEKTIDEDSQIALTSASEPQSSKKSLEIGYIDLHSLTKTAVNLLKSKPLKASKQKEDGSKESGESEKKPKLLDEVELINNRYVAFKILETLFGDYGDRIEYAFVEALKIEPSLLSEALQDLDECNRSFQLLKTLQNRVIASREKLLRYSQHSEISTPDQQPSLLMERIEEGISASEQLPELPMESIDDFHQKLARLDLLEGSELKLQLDELLKDATLDLLTTENSEKFNAINIAVILRNPEILLGLLEKLEAIKQETIHREKIADEDRAKFEKSFAQNLAKNKNIVIAVTNQNSRAISALLSSSVFKVIKDQLVDESDNSGDSVVCLAAFYNDKESIIALADEGANLNALDSEGNTPIFIAANYGNLEAVKALIERGAQPIASDYDGDSDESANSAIHVAANHGYLEVVDLLIKSGLKVDTEDEDHETPLNLAAQTGKLDVVNFLIEKGAKIEGSERSEYTPLQLASQNGHLEVARVLLKNKASVARTDKKGYTALHFAAENGRLELMKLLLEAKSDINYHYPSDKDFYFTPLHVAIANDKDEVVKFLLENGADANVKIKRGPRPIDYAINFRGNRYKSIQTLFENGADTEHLKSHLYNRSSSHGSFDIPEELMVIIRKITNPQEIELRDERLKEKNATKIQVAPSSPSAALRARSDSITAQSAVGLIGSIGNSAISSV